MWDAEIPQIEQLRSVGARMGGDATVGQGLPAGGGWSLDTTPSIPDGLTTLAIDVASAFVPPIVAAIASPQPSVPVPTENAAREGVRNILNQMLIPPTEALIDRWEPYRTTHNPEAIAAMIADEFGTAGSRGRVLEVFAQYRVSPTADELTRLAIQYDHGNIDVHNLAETARVASTRSTVTTSALAPVSAAQLAADNPKVAAPTVVNVAASPAVAPTTNTAATTGTEAGSLFDRHPWWFVGALLAWALL